MALVGIGRAFWGFQGVMGALDVPGYPGVWADCSLPSRGINANKYISIVSSRWLLACLDLRMSEAVTDFGGFRFFTEASGEKKYSLRQPGYAKMTAARIQFMIPLLGNLNNFKLHI